MNNSSNNEQTHGKSFSISRVFGLLLTVITSIVLLIKVISLFGIKNPNIESFPFAFSRTDFALGYFSQLIGFALTVLLFSLGLCSITKKWIIMIIGLVMAVVAITIISLSGILNF